MRAMDLLKEHGILFGTSICYTRDNIEAVTSDEFMRFLCDKGAHFGFYFHYMPVGNEAAPELMPSPEQRKYMIQRIRYLRSEACDIPFYPMDFQNDGEFVGGCIAGGRNYFHINSAGDAEPCVFIHYSNANIHDSSILEILRSPLFMLTTTVSPSTKTICVPAPCWKTPSCCARWFTRPVPTAPTCSPRKASIICATSASPMPPTGSPPPTRSGPIPRSARAVTRTIRIGSPISSDLQA